jgi:hypothetical protein
MTLDFKKNAIFYKTLTPSLKNSKVQTKVWIKSNLVTIQKSYKLHEQDNFTLGSAHPLHSLPKMIVPSFASAYIGT